MISAFTRISECFIFLSASLSSHNKTNQAVEHLECYRGFNLIEKIIDFQVQSDAIRIRQRKK
jgi:hypothetical protein